MFGQGDNQYPGMLATQDIEKDDIICKIPSREIITTRAAFYSDLQPLFFEHPELFGKHVQEGEDMMLYAFILHEIQQKEKSQYWHMIRMWPKDTDILMNWDDEDLEWLQDDTLVNEANKQYDDFMDSWKRLYDTLVLYPKYFQPESISLNRFKWVYILTTNRCFSSNWPGVC